LVQLQVAQTPLSDHRCYGLEAWRPLRPRILHIKEAASVVEQAWFFFFLIVTGGEENSPPEFHYIDNGVGPIMAHNTGEVTTRV